MIKELPLWRLSLAKHAEDLQALCDAPWENTEQQVFGLEVGLLTSAVMMRRLHDTQCVSFAVEKPTIPVKRFAPLGTPITRLNRASMMACFNMKEGTEENFDATNLTSIIIHGYILHFGFDFGSKNPIFCITSDTRKELYLLLVNFKDYIELVKMHANDSFSFSMPLSNRKGREFSFNTNEQHNLDSPQLQDFVRRHKLIFPQA